MSTPDALALLRRWEESGATWRVVALSSDRVEIALCTCAGAEQVDRLVSDDPAVLAYVGARGASDGRPAR